MRRLLIFLWVMTGVALPATLLAHTPSESFSRWQYSEHTLVMQFTVTAREASRIETGSAQGSLQTRLADYLNSHITVDDPDSGPDNSPDNRCRKKTGPNILASQPGYVRIELSWWCETPPQSLTVRAFFDLAPEHVHFASLASPTGLGQRLLTAENPVWVLDGLEISRLEENQPLDKVAQSGFIDYLQLGFRHILGGLDHVVFLVGVLLLCRRFSDLAWAVSGFTLGHSITLSLAALGLAQANIPGIEASIGLTIALVAIERTAKTQRSAMPLALMCAGFILVLILSGAGERGSIGNTGLFGLGLFSFCYLLLSKTLGNRGSFRALVTTLFGLVHGFGFAGAFITAGAGQGSLLLPLAGFNIGIELGQLVLVTALFALGMLFRNRSPYATLTADSATAIVCGFGVFWFVQRNLFGGVPF